ncbi:hypothetical protein F5Y19DRAFT_473523 [Xylariaceae sp. FL1651]|nr:hypothetical protein F5Y19DRAFT_473523 [Xylariaceae sp. FL1651]
MENNNNLWSRMVFRLRGLPHIVETLEGVASLVEEGFCDASAHGIRVFSLATSLSFWEIPPTKVATIMFAAAPSIIQNNYDSREWTIPVQSRGFTYNLILDTHFMGMTPLNDVKPLSHQYDCIAISGLASHPFGSWQPKSNDKTFMWIRDGLPKDIHGIRSVLYGYDTKLYESQSFQDISDLASEFINQLQAYGWNSSSAKSVAFVSHSLGGLVLKKALVQLASSSNENYKTLLNVIRGALFFGVPNLGMEQASFHTIVQNGPNAVLIDDIGRKSNFLRRLNESFFNTSINGRFRFFWAYETLESPTAIRNDIGEISRDGPWTILVSRESATYRFTETNPCVTFPIKATHSDMVKFTRDSHIYHVVVSKLLSILSLSSEGEYSESNISLDGAQSGPAAHGHGRINTNQDLLSTPSIRAGAHQSSTKVNLTAELETFRRLSSITESEENDFPNMTFDIVKNLSRKIQEDHEREKKLMYMQRLEPFLISMQQFGKVAEDAGVSFGAFPFMGYVWGPMQHILSITSTYRDALHSILNAYQDIGEKIPYLEAYKSRLISSPHLKDILVMIYIDVLWFHGEILRQLVKREWKTLFRTSWAGFAPYLEQIRESIARSERSIISNVSVTEFEEIRNLRTSALHTFKTHRAAHDVSCRATVMQWLSPFNCEAEQNRHRRTRSICVSPGTWLLNDPRFKQWFSPEFCSTPLLWLNGIPGAGKTILASIIVDEAQQIPGATVVYFYCKHGDEARYSFTSIARSILAQMLVQCPDLLPFFYERASVSGDVFLESTPIAKEMVQTALNSCNKAYVIIDGVDECGRDDREEIAEIFQTIVEALPTTEVGSTRCLFVSQDDGVARRDFRDIPALKIVDENQKDIENFALVWHQNIEKKFGPLRSKDCHVSNIISARAQGMFIFADLFAKYLEDQLDRSALLLELHPAKLPVSLDHVYERILQRIFESRGDHIVNPLRQVLGWIACARRPLRWAEIQGAVCIDLDNQNVDHNKKISDSPKGLFASLVELQKDDTVKLVHETAREYLLRRNIISSQEIDYSLAMLSIGYLTLPQMDRQRNEEDIQSDFFNGIYSFYDYASACWAMHLTEGISDMKSSEELTQLLETLETFIELHWSPTHKPLQDLQRVRKALTPIRASESFERVVHAVGWARKQSSKYGQGPSHDEALDLWQVTHKIRLVLEHMQSPKLLSVTERRLQQFYGPNWFKCPRVNCLHYFQGFSTAEQQQHHINKHDRPFLCFVSGCHMEVFGYATKSELNKHLFKNHGIDMFDDTEDVDFPDPPKPKATNKAKSEATYQCPQCDKKFTRSHNLKSHLRSHQGLKPYACCTCSERFTRKSDCDRHKRGHKEKTFICVGSLKDGSTWGCKTSFGRLDNLVAHFRSKTGRKCIRPQLEEKLQEGGDSVTKGESKLFDGQIGENADALQAAGKSLPTFEEFLRLCGLDKPELGPKSEAESSNKAAIE